MSTTNEFSFDTAKDWRVCTTAPGTREIIMDRNGTVSHLTTTRGKCHVGSAADEWLNDHPKAMEHLTRWLKARREAVGAWKHATPHHRYDADRGSLAVRVNGARVLVGNGVGDGNFPVYLIEESGSMNAEKPAPNVLPHTFAFTGFSVDACVLDVLDYDCDGAHAIASLDVESAMFYRDGEGAVVVKYTIAQ